MFNHNYQQLADELITVLKAYEARGVQLDWSGDFGNEIGRIVGESLKEDPEAIKDFIDGIEHGIDLSINHH